MTSNEHYIVSPNGGVEVYHGYHGDTAFNEKSRPKAPAKPKGATIGDKVRYHILPDNVIWVKEIGGNENILATPYDGSTQ